MSLNEFFKQQTETAAYKDYENIVNELNKFRLNNPMTNSQANILRHRAGSAGFAQQHGFFPAIYYGLGKEVKDLFVDKKGLADSMEDLGNNLYGALVGKFSPNKTRQTLYEQIYQGIKK